MQGIAGKLRPRSCKQPACRDACEEHLSGAFPLAADMASVPCRSVMLHCTLEPTPAPTDSNIGLWRVGADGQRSTWMPS